MIVIEKDVYVLWKWIYNIEVDKIIFFINVFYNWMCYIVFIFEIKYFYGDKKIFVESEFGNNGLFIK